MGPLTRLSSGHTVDEAGASPGAPEQPTDPRKDSTANRKCGSGSSGASGTGILARPSL
jgi:hypothetical protein